MTAPVDQDYAERLIRARVPELAGVDLAAALDCVPASLVGAVMSIVENIEDRLRVVERQLAER
jgi:hypothetical protein